MTINSETDMKEFTLDIIQTLHEEKKKRNIIPDFVTRSEILEFIRNRIDRSLKGLEEDGEIKSGEMWNLNNRYYEITNNGKSELQSNLQQASVKVS
jgi:DNA-binding PadR family transcriptional regulator